MITFQDIRSDKEFETMIAHANGYLQHRGYTEHGFRHVNYVAEMTAYILKELDYDERIVELGRMAGYLHDIGNLVNRKYHGVSGAHILYTELRRRNMPLDEVLQIVQAVGNHEEEIGKTVSPISAALILADKSDAHRTRAGKTNLKGIHARVNLAIQDSSLSVNHRLNSIDLSITFDTTKCQVMDYFEIYLKRMEMCKEAASFLGRRFRLLINNLELLGMVEQRSQPAASVQE